MNLYNQTLHKQGLQRRRELKRKFVASKKSLRQFADEIDISPQRLSKLLNGSKATNAKSRAA